MKRFAQILAKYVENSGKKQTRIASDAHISYNYLLRLLSGDRNPSDQVVQRLAEALHLSAEQTGELLAAAGYTPTALLMESGSSKQAIGHKEVLPPLESNQALHVAQQLLRLSQEVPEELQRSFLEEMKHLLGYARYKYLFSGGADILNLLVGLSKTKPEEEHSTLPRNDSLSLDFIAQLIGELHIETRQGDMSGAEEVLQLPSAVEEMLSAIDHLTGDILTGEVIVGSYQSQLILQTLGVLGEGTPWEIRRRVAEALPGICQLDAPGAIRLMETLRLDKDEVRGVDIRRRVIEALPVLTAASPATLSNAIRLLYPRPGDDHYVALAIVEACGDTQDQVKQLIEQSLAISHTAEIANLEISTAFLQQCQIELAKIQRQVLASWDGMEREYLEFSIALHNLLHTPDTLLLSLREGLQSSEKLIQLVSTRYIERLLPSKPKETLELYQKLLQSTVRHKNVRRTVAKALPGLLQCLKEASLPVRVLARAVISDLATDSDIYIRQAVADHAMQIFHIDREFLLILLRQMHKDSDQAIRYRLRPVALRLAQVWLVWYAETAGLVDTNDGRQKIGTPFGESAWP